MKNKKKKSIFFNVTFLNVSDLVKSFANIKMHNKEKYYGTINCKKRIKCI